MCFSAGASFAGATILAGSGAASLQKSSRRTRFFALIPLLFAVQQIIEGAQWIVLERGEANMCLGYGFLFFAFLLWPIYIPFSIFQMERDASRRRVMRLWLYLGILVTCVMIGGLLWYPLSITAMTNHIEYYIAIPGPMLLSALYTLAVCMPGLLSSYKYVRIFAGLVFLFSILSGAIYMEAYVSTWCFFAAILSIFVAFGVQEAENDVLKKKRS